jgi:hypothetical protein
VEKQVTVVAGKTAHWAYPTPRPPPRPTGTPAGPGWLKIITNAWVRVYVDGSFANECPCLPLELSPGRHRIRIVNEDAGWEQTEVIEITSGSTVERRYRL